MKKAIVYIIVSGIIAAFWLLLTGWLAFGHFTRYDSFLHTFSFYFHIIPFGIGFGGGTTISFYISYLIIWLVITLFLVPIVKVYFSIKRKKLFLSLTVGPIILFLIIGLIIDHSNNAKWEELKAESQAKNEKDFNHIKTGDLLFQVITKDSLDSSFQFADSTYNNIGIAFISYGNYALLRTEGGFISIRHWVDRGYNRHFVVKRLIDADSLLSNDEQTNNFEKTAREYLMKDMHTSNEWPNNKICNSERICIVFKHALNVDLCPLEIKEKMNIDSNTDDHIEYKASVSAIFNSDKLITVKKE